MLEGQINRGSALGEIIYNLALRQDVYTIVDIGAWNGLGSTKCIRDAVIAKRKPCNVLAIEAYESMYKQAIQYDYPKIEGFNLVYGRVVDLDELTWFDKNTLNEDEKKWLYNDTVNYGMCPNVKHMLPDKVDLLILDGGEFSTYVEFMNLHDRARFIVLDDTHSNTIKCIEIRKYILANPSKFSVLHDVTNERNGYMAVENLSYVK
jgi:hypothetical protein